MRNWHTLSAAISGALCVLAFVLLLEKSPAAEKSSDSRTPLFTAEAIVSSDDARSRFLERVRSYADHNRFAIRVDQLPGGETYVGLWRYDVHLSVDTAFSRSKFFIWLYRNCDHPILDADIEVIMNEFEADVAKVPGVTVSRKK